MVLPNIMLLNCISMIQYLLILIMDQFNEIHKNWYYTNIEETTVFKK